MFQQGYTGAEIDRHFGFGADYANSIRRKRKMELSNKRYKILVECSTTIAKASRL